MQRKSGGRVSGRPGDGGTGAPAARLAGRQTGDGDGRELPGLSRARTVLAAGGAVVVPNPFPMAYGVLATSARAVNSLKGRPQDRNVAVSLHDRSQWHRVAPAVDLTPPALDAAAALMGLRVSVLLPLRRRVPHPGWVTPAVRDGYLAAFNGYWDVTAPLWERFPRLFGSSANLTGRVPAISAAGAVSMFGADCAVVDADGLEAREGPRSASTMVRIDRTGRLELYRSGAQDATSGLRPGEFLRRLAGTVGLPGQGTGS